MKKIKIWERPNLRNTVNKELGMELKFVYSKNGTLSVIFHNNNLLLGVVGEFNDNLKELEKLLKQIYILEEIQF